VEVCINGTWGTVCDDLWGVEEASVACSQLGFSSAGKQPYYTVIITIAMIVRRMRYLEISRAHCQVSLQMHGMTNMHLRK
jgi:hypothetical protein